MLKYCYSSGLNNKLAMKYEIREQFYLVATFTRTFLGSPNYG